MATSTEYKGYWIDTYEEAGKWRARIRRPGDVPVKVGGRSLQSWPTPERCDTEQQALDLAKEHIDRGSVF